MVAALVSSSSGCVIESARDRWLSARDQASRDFGCPVERLSMSGGKYRPRASGCGQSAEYRCERRERRADQDIEQELDHVWETYYVCRRTDQEAVSTP